MFVPVKSAPALRKVVTMSTQWSLIEHLQYLWKGRSESFLEMSNLFIVVETRESWGPSEKEGKKLDDCTPKWPVKSATMWLVKKNTHMHWEMSVPVLGGGKKIKNKHHDICLYIQFKEKLARKLCSLTAATLGQCSASVPDKDQKCSL